MLTPAQRRRALLRKKGIIGPDRRDFREGMLWGGRWIDPCEMHATAARRCAWFDAQMKSVRNYINRNGKLPEGALRMRVKSSSR